ncbi:Protein kinase superfamily protein [Zostera marina]|uniref:Protein kinase superfamily protein n=1 Tax=Zostera marina TaxID=29655 RepID=A0A0K9PRC0_ZOSMR|nr:Protein kinase superfamily protein [Zostera marina]
MYARRVMEARKSTIIASLAVVLDVCLIIIFWTKIKKGRTLFALIAVCVAFIVVVFVWIVIRYSNLDYRRRLSMKRRIVLEGKELRQEYSFLRKVAGMPRRFKYEELVTATHDFSNLIGRGSSASVFKGELEDGTKVAVKRIEETSERGEREFRSEVCAIANTQHINLVRLLGFCLVPNTDSRFLVYEFVHNGSLNQWIFPKLNGDIEMGLVEEKCLPWKSRYQVAIDVGKALAYLHHQCRQKVVHLDVKPENILLDEQFCAQVADFGLSKLMAKDQSRIISRIRGTKGYLAPEWLIGRGVSEKSDVYSYGMVLMELVGGRRNTKREGQKWTYFPKIVADKIVEGKIMEVVDQRLMDSHDGSVPSEKEVKALTYVGLWCVQEEPKLRPSMARVVDMLEGRLPIEKPPETDMVIVDMLGDRDKDLYPQPCATEPTLATACNKQQLQPPPPLTSVYSLTESTVSIR